MKRTTIYLKENVDLELARLAKQEGSSKAELIRTALDTFVEERKKQTPRKLPTWIGAGRSGIPDLAEKVDEFLGEIYEEDYKAGLESWEEHKKREHSS